MKNLTSKELNKIKEEFDSLNEKGQWSWLVKTDLKEHFTLRLDNDNTTIFFQGDDEDGVLLSFKDDCGNRAGVEHLLICIGIKAECV